MPVAVSRQKDGCWTCSFVPPAAGYYRLELILDGKPAGRSPYAVQVRCFQHAACRPAASCCGQWV